MQIKSLHLKNFRNYESLNLEFSKYKNIIIGNNGLGKTNIIEAIYYLALTKSFRTNNDEPLINENSTDSLIEANIIDKINHKYRIYLTKEGKNIKVDNKPIKNISDYISKINIVLFTQEDLKLIKDNPSTHRKLIDMEISQFNNEYLKLLSMHKRIIKQRNLYLKEMYLNGNISNEYLDILTKKLVEIGFKIYQIRREFINNLNQYIPNIYARIVKKENLKIKYLSQYDNKNTNDLYQLYKKNLNKDINYGKTSIGVHLDDYFFEINQKNIKDYLSEGEQKNSIIAMKIAEIKYCMDYQKKSPILILDDLFSELDNNKINNIISFFNKKCQIIITTTDIDKINSKLLTNCRIFKITKEKVEVKNYE